MPVREKSSLRFAELQQLSLAQRDCSSWAVHSTIEEWAAHEAAGWSQLSVRASCTAFPTT
jgi:hypothetical protein